MREMKFKRGDRIKVDQSTSAYHRKRGIRYEYGTFVEYQFNESDGSLEAVVNLHGSGWDSVWEPEMISKGDE